MESLVELRAKFATLTADKKVGDFSFETGWVPLLWGLAAAIERLDVKCRQEFSIWQVKEKFGRLSILGAAGPEISRLIEEAESTSARICAVCGQPGNLVMRGWYRVLCTAHQNQ
jgi:hypothetical protein